MTQTTRTDDAQGSHLFTLLGVVPILIWGAAVALAGSLSASVGALTSAGLVYLVAGPLGLLALRFRGQLGTFLSELRARAVLYCFTFFALNVTLFWTAIGLATSNQEVAELGVVNYLWPSLTLLCSIPILGKRPRTLFYAGVLCAATGAAASMLDARHLSLHEASVALVAHPLSFITILASAFAWAIYSNLTRRFGAGVNAAAVSLYLTVIGALLVTVGFLSNEPHDFTTRAMVELPLLAIGDALAYTLWDLGMRRGNHATVASLSYLTPLFSTVTTALYLGFVPGAGVWAGCALVIVGATICSKTLD